MPKHRAKTKSPSKLSNCNHGDYVRVDEWYRVTLKPMGLRRCKADGSEDNSSTGWRPCGDMVVLEHRAAPPSVDQGEVEVPI